MAEKLEWTELSGNGGSEHGLMLGQELLELQRMLSQARPWWHKGACWFVAFCVANTMMIWWAAALGFIEGDLVAIGVMLTLLFCAMIGAMMQSVQARRD